jgi:hypothetical protein
MLHTLLFPTKMMPTFKRPAASTRGNDTALLLMANVVQSIILVMQEQVGSRLVCKKEL